VAYTYDRRGSYDRRHARAIPIDKEAVAEFVEGELVPRIMRWLARRPNRDEPIGDVHEFADETFEMWGVNHQRLEFDVFVGARHSTAKGAAVLGGSMNAEDMEIRLFINGALTPNDILVPSKWLNRLAPLRSCTHETCLPFGLYTTMIHEVTHASESVFKQKLQYSPSEVREKGEAAFGPYLNDPGEVRAHMQQVVDEVVRMADRDMIRENAKGKPNPNQALIHMCLMLSTTFGIIEKHLTPHNRSLILKAVFQALEHEGLLFDE
jgi:hypothetical protein